MLIQEATYVIQPTQDVYNILSTEDLTVNIYDYEDTVTPLRTYSVSNGVLTDLEFECTDGRYIIEVTNGVFTNEHIFIFYPFFETQVLNEIYNFVCTCDGCPDEVMDDCNDCKEDDDCKSQLAFASYLYAHMFLFSDQLTNTAFANYMQYTLLLFNDKLYSRYKAMFFHGIVKGDYPLVVKDLAIYYSAIYVYYYLKEYSENTDSDYVDTKYKIVNFKECLKKIGLAFSSFFNVYVKHTTFGKYYVDDLSAVSNLCTEVADILYNPNISKEDYEAGISFNVLTAPKDIVLITPKSWGALTEILDNGGANLITDTTQSECGDYYLYWFDYQFPPNTYTFKIVV